MGVDLPDDSRVCPLSRVILAGVAEDGSFRHPPILPPRPEAHPHNGRTLAESDPLAPESQGP